MKSDADFGAVTLDGAAAAEGRDWPAEILAERDEEVVEFDPKARREFFTEGHFRLFRSFRFDISETI